MHSCTVIVLLFYINSSHANVIQKKTSEPVCYDEVTDTFLPDGASIPSADGKICTCRAPEYEMICTSAKRYSEMLCYDQFTDTFLRAGEEIPSIGGRVCYCVPDIYELACTIPGPQPCVDGHSVCGAYSRYELEDYCADEETQVAEICCASCQGYMKRSTQHTENEIDANSLEKKESEPMCLHGENFLHAGQSVYEGDHICTCTGNYVMMCSRAFEKRFSEPKCLYNGAFFSAGQSVWDDPGGDSVCTCTNDYYMVCSRAVAKKNADGWWCPLPGGGELALGADAFLTPGDNCMRCTCGEYGGEIELGCVPCFDLDAN